MTFRRHPRRKRASNVTVPMSTLTRWLTYDIGVPERNAIASRLGLVPVSDEVDSMECADSDHRLMRLTPISPVIESYACLVAQVTLAAMTSVTGEEASDLQRQQYEAISLTSIVGFLSAFLELELFHAQYPGADRELC